MNLFVVAAVVIILIAMFGANSLFSLHSRTDKTRYRKRQPRAAMATVTDEQAPALALPGTAAPADAAPEEAWLDQETIETEAEYEYETEETEAEALTEAATPATAAAAGFIIEADSDPESGPDSATGPLAGSQPLPPARRHSAIRQFTIVALVVIIFLALGYVSARYLPFSGNEPQNRAVAGYLQPADPCAGVTPDLNAVSAFIAAGCYKNWVTQEPPQRLSGVAIDGVYYTRHQYLQVYYSPKVAVWLGNDRQGPLPDGSMIVALEYASGEQPGELQRILSRLKAGAGSHDGWFWSSIPVDDPQTAYGRFGASRCLACHSAADNPELVFIDTATSSADAKENQQTSAGAAWKPAPALRWPQPEPPPVKRSLTSPLATADQGFLDRFKLPDVAAEEVVPFPGKEHDHVAATGKPGDFITADQCIGCHNAAQLLSHTRPALWYPNPNQQDDDEATAVYRNYSPYGEWSASMNGLSSRDPVWHAQIESERFLRPQLADFTDDICFSCHAPMGGRQLRRDSNDPSRRFTSAMFYAGPDDTHGKYAALARDGISCMVCHTMSMEKLGIDPEFEPGAAHVHKHPDQLNSYTALFEVGDVIGGPYRDSQINATTMKRALGLTAAYTKHTGEAKLCGSCHTVIVPALPVDYQGSDPHSDPDVRIAFEQTTYWEWRNTVFQNEREPKGEVPAPCQVCHMFPHNRTRIANIENNEFPPLAGRLADKQLELREHNPFWRHTLLAINMPVYKMFQQFPQILLGTQPADPAVPERTLNPLLNGEDWMSSFSENKVVNLEILSAEEQADRLEVELQLTNFAGHKMPTGAGFRRAFIELRVIAATGKVLWVSGDTDRYGVIVDGDKVPLVSEFTRDPNQSQPHYQVITHQNQVQIYETRSLDSSAKLQSTVLGIYREYKDNRLLPLGWDAAGPNTFATTPKLPAAPSQRTSDNLTRSGDGSAVGRQNTNCYDGYDPDYCEAELTGNGQDHIRYRIFLDTVKDWAAVEARLWYQTIPPYYLADRFRSGQQDGVYGRDTKRLTHITSRLNLTNSKAENWKMQLGKTAVMRKGEAAHSGLSLQQALQRVKIPNRY